MSITLLPWSHPATLWSLNYLSESGDSEFNYLLVIHRNIWVDQVHSWMLVSFLSSKKCCSLYRVQPVFFTLASQSYIGFQIQNCDNIPAKVVFTVFDQGEKKTYWIKYGRILLLNFLPPENKWVSGNPKDTFPHNIPVSGKVRSRNVRLFLKCHSFPLVSLGGSDFSAIQGIPSCF